MNKRITNLSIKGLNTSMPDSIVPDGACDVLTNMRFRDGSWQSMGNIAQVADIPLPDIGVTSANFVSFVGIHEVEGKEHYICKCIIGLGGDNYELHLCVYHDSKWEDLGTISTYYTTTKLKDIDIRVTSFGKVLIVRSDDKMQHYIWNEGKYSLFTMPKPVSVFENKTTYTMPAEADTTDGDGNNWWYLMNEGGDIMRPIGNALGNVWWGEICYLVAYRMKDGSILSPSPLRILCSEKDTNGVTSLELRKKLFDKNTYYAIKPNSNVVKLGQFQFFRPKLLIKIPEGIDTTLIDRVAIYSTRINSIVDYERILKEYYDSKGTKYYSTFYADNNLPDQPFYLVEEKKLTTITNNTWEIELGYDKLENLSTKKQEYTPPQMHSIYAESLYDYNNRLHLGALTSKLYSHYSAAYSSNPETFQELVELDEVGSVLSHLITPTQLPPAEDEEYGEVVSSSGDVHLVTPILSYPDYRATSIRFVNVGDDGICEDKKMLKPATANNFAYYITPTNGIIKYPQEGFAVNRAIDSVTDSPIFSEPNRIQVSAPNNPFSLPFENSYAVGNEGSRVVAMNTVADSLVDSNFYGNYPLYIFTTDGIFALRSGSGEVLYAGTEIINHDKLINPNTIALNGSVVYACTEGLKALTGRQGVRISADIDPIALIGAEFGINWEYGELLCRLSSGKVYVWNVGANVWSQREDITGHIKDGYIGQPTQADGILIYDINKENEGEINIKLQTRPLKFDSLGFKKIDSLIARLASTNANVWNIKVESSNDCQQWHMIKWVTTQGMTSDIGLRRFGPSARFYRLTIEGTVKGKVAFTQIDMAIQDRYNNKLR